MVLPPLPNWRLMVMMRFIGHPPFASLVRIDKDGG
jgi:hypothetical protein